jgi:hypothetical protein
VVRHPVEDQPDAGTMTGGQQPIEVFQRSEHRVDVA